MILTPPLIFTLHLYLKLQKKYILNQYSHKDFPDYLANENGNTIQDNIIQYFHAIGRFIQPLLHDWCFSTGIQNYYSLLLNIGENK